MARKPKQFDIEMIMNASDEQKRQWLPELAKTANSRLKTLENRGKTQWAYERVLKDLRTPKDELPRFQYQVKGLTETQLNNRLSDILRFLSSRTSTASGVKEIERERLSGFKDRGFELSNEESFKQFLYSSQFEALKAYGDSDLILEDFDQALSEGYNMTEIMESYQEFMDTDLGLNEVESRRAQKKLLRFKD